MRPSTPSRPAPLLRGSSSRRLAAALLLAACGARDLDGRATDGGAPGSDGGGAPPACGRTHDTLSLTMTLPDKTTTYDCQHPSPKVQSFIGEVLSAGDRELVLATCPPTADCSSDLPVKITVSAPGLPALSTLFPPGGFVHADVDIQRPWACVARVVLKSVVSWFGVPNPAGPGDVLYLAAGDGLVAPLDGAPFRLDAVRLGCKYDGTSCSPGGPAIDDYLFRFRAVADKGTSVEVTMGATRLWDLGSPSSTRRWNVRNLRSYETGACDDSFNWGYWIAPAILGE